ncbi:MAG: formate--tetrahydrofolate ligase [Candidatus Ancillula sp.]|jgi:formate--tetrahydrofolate ligase|nr:formate--tetrahydrofolate ligase [Candidatus Ancillula sp.]
MWYNEDMDYKTDIEIATSVKPKAIHEVASTLGINVDELEFYGRYKAKLPLTADENAQKSKAKLILVTAINPTPAGEGKTTTTVGLTDALRKLGNRTVGALREPSLGPVFGVKGGATGGGYAQVIPMEDINLHFTGDFHAIGAANNLLVALLDNHIKQGNETDVDPTRIVLKRSVDMNDRQLRHITSGLSHGANGTINGIVREDGFEITVASEVMAVFCLATDLLDLKTRLGEIVVAYNRSGKPVKAKDLKAHGAMTALLKDAFLPNLVQTLEGTPVLIHGGPFANIAHGCNSVVATKKALELAGDDGYVVTEAGFGADLGAEKFFDIKCRKAGLKPDAVVIVATIRALKYHGGVEKTAYNEENLVALKKGLENLYQHVNNIQDIFGLKTVVALNKFYTDTDEEISLVKSQCDAKNIPFELSEVWEKGSNGAVELANTVIETTKKATTLKYAYELNQTIEEKLDAIAKKVYKADGVSLTVGAKRQLETLKELGFEQLPICMAKTQYSFSDDPKKLGAPRGFKIQIRELKVSAGAGFIVAITGSVMTMPGLPKIPAANNIDIDGSGTITGLF